MRHADRCGQAVSQEMATDFSMFKDPEALLTKRSSADTVAVQDPCVCGQTGQNRRRRIFLRPVKYIRKRIPIRLFPQIWLTRLRARHDDAVKALLQQLCTAHAKLIEMLLCPFASDYVWQGKQFDLHRQAIR